ncbi:hypothetical protein IP98_02556 [Flavobacterium cauense R2A-7]|uniref:Uncharacterized protein n=1 Tax=Flavobacterium cauense R2A-7 TaxID=1341154 RepID=A0A562LNK9_9FLAO|nr:hypothetical protein IP98_02556 [Flavobacterium cauense R2A-7]
MNFMQVFIFKAELYSEGRSQSDRSHETKNPNNRQPRYLDFFYSILSGL